MKIGISCIKYGLGRYGGIQVYLRNLLRALAAHNSDGNQYVLLLLPGQEIPPEAGQPAFSSFVLNPPPELILPLRMVKRLASPFRLAGALPPRASERLSQQIADLRLDLIHFPGTTIDPGCPVPDGLAVVLTFHDMQHEFFPGYFSKKELKRRSISYRSSAGRASLIMADSAFTAHSLKKIYGIPDRRIRIVPLGVSPSFTTGLDSAHLESVRNRYALPEHFIFYPANPWPHKNFSCLFQALNLLRETQIRCWALVTTGRLARQKIPVSALAAENGFPDHLLFDLRFVEEADMPALYAMATMMVFPSLFEGFGLPLLEAMACGCPVICSDKTSLPEIGGDAVHYIDAHDPHSIAAAISALSDHPEKREQLRQRGLKRAADFSWERVMRDVFAAYREAGS